MNDLLLEYKKKYEDDDVNYLDFPSKELCEAWLDAQIAYCKKIQELKEAYGADLDLCFGVFLRNEEEFEGKISNILATLETVCCGKPYLQIYEGIQFLAKGLGLQLYRSEFNDNYRFEYYFNYKGIKIMQVSNCNFDAKEV